jgi:predicted lipoprotein with Yx(FWY)xxD motif
MQDTPPESQIPALERWFGRVDLPRLATILAASAPPWERRRTDNEVDAMSKFALAAAVAAGLCVASAAMAMNHLMADDFVGKFKVMGNADAPFLANEKGLTMYTFEKDADGKPTCVAACAEQFPPVLVVDGDMAVAPFTFVARDDGKRQWAIENHPLYLNAKDAAPGDTNGRDVAGWSTVKVAAHEM